MERPRSIAAFAAGAALPLALAGCGRSGLGSDYWPVYVGPREASSSFLPYVRARVGRENALTDEELARFLARDRFVCEPGGAPDERRCRASFRAPAYGLMSMLPPYGWTIYDNAELTDTAQRYAPGRWRFTNAIFRRLTDHWDDRQRRNAERRQVRTQ